MENVNSLTASAQEFFTIKFSGRSVYVGTHFGVGFTVLLLAIFVAAIPAGIHQLLVPTSNPPIATVWPLNARSGELAFSERFGRRRGKVEWCVPRDGPSQTVASSVGSMVAKFNANPNCKEGLNLTVGFQTMRQIVTPSNLLTALESSTMIRLSRVAPAAGTILGLDVPLSRKTDIKYAIESHYEGLSDLSPSGSKGCDAAVTTVVTISRTSKTPTATEIDCTAYGVDMHDKTSYEFIMCYHHGKVGAYKAENRTVAIFVSTKAQATGSSWDFVYSAYTPKLREFTLLTDWKRRYYTLDPGKVIEFDPLNMEEMRLVDMRVDDITIQEFVGKRECRALKGNGSDPAFENDGTADHYILGSWQQSGNIVHTDYSAYQATTRDMILIEFASWQGPPMGKLLVNIACSNSLASTSAKSKPWCTRTCFFVRQNARGGKFVLCEENDAGVKPVTFKRTTKSCQESDKKPSGYTAAPTEDAMQTSDLVRSN